MDEKDFTKLLKKAGYKFIRDGNSIKFQSIMSIHNPVSIAAVLVCVLFLTMSYVVYPASSSALGLILFIVFLLFSLYGLWRIVNRLFSYVKIEKSELEVFRNLKTIKRSINSSARIKIKRQKETWEMKPHSTTMQTIEICLKQDADKILLISYRLDESETHLANALSGEISKRIKAAF